MQKNSIPPYKPPPEILAAIEKQKLQQQQNPSRPRKHSAVLPKRNWVYRNPRLFQVIFITSSLLVFFSKPLYDAFIAVPVPPPREFVPPHRR